MWKSKNFSMRRENSNNANFILWLNLKLLAALENQKLVYCLTDTQCHLVVCGQTSSSVFEFQEFCGNLNLFLWLKYLGCLADLAFPWLIVVNWHLISFFFFFFRLCRPTWEESGRAPSPGSEQASRCGALPALRPPPTMSSSALVATTKKRKKSDGRQQQQQM